MIDREKTFFVILLVFLIYPGDNFSGAFKPEFLAPLENLTIPLGRDAVFTCQVEHLGGYRVGWVKVDTKAIQAIHDHVITHNPRVSVFHGDHTTWKLRIKGAQKEDEGLYMCQINTDPMKSQTGVLTVQIPPDFIPNETSGDMVVTEGRDVNLRCKATGIPPPKVSWKREDQKEITIREPIHNKSSGSNEKFKVRTVLEWVGEELNLTKIKRDQMGVYNCIASNQVPPSISKRIIVDVHFQPEILVPNQLVGAPLGTDVVLECIVQAFPQSITFWRNRKDEMIISSGRHEVQTVSKTSGKGHKAHDTASHPNFKVLMLLTIHNFTKEDVGTYKCTAKNSNGENEGSIRLYDISSAMKQKSPGDSSHSQPHDNSAYDLTDSSDDSLSELEAGRDSGSLDNTVRGQTQVGGSSGADSSNGHQYSLGSNSLAAGSKSRSKRPHLFSASTRLLGTSGLLPLLLLLLVSYCR